MFFECTNIDCSEGQWLSHIVLSEISHTIPWWDQGKDHSTVSVHGVPAIDLTLSLLAAVNVCYTGFFYSQTFQKKFRWKFVFWCMHILWGIFVPQRVLIVNMVFLCVALHAHLYASLLHIYLGINKCSLQLWPDSQYPILCPQFRPDSVKVSQYTFCFTNF